MDNNAFPLPNSAQPSVGAQPSGGQAQFASGLPVMPAVQPAAGQIAVTAPTTATAVQAADAVKPKHKNISSLIKTIAIVVLSLVSVTFIGLFIWMTMRYNEASEDVEGQIEVAVAEERYATETKLEAEFLEREKNPYRTFSGPADYGQLTFEYPKTWSVYVAADASKGGDFTAYFNPVEVEAVSKETVNALRVRILDKEFASVTADYQKYLNRKNYNFEMEAITVFNNAANLYYGTIPNTDLSGYITVFKIRDKTAILQTDSVLFKDDYDRVISTITYNE